ncbi:restriction endonuclease subunit S [Nocardiopsis rhodophaea]|uniref:Restriction endonuclease subunit S n=1 Tax=Nocardiopsis rhodophaea TaxID=280238 RepID=A0ABP5EC68_9ACTN
MPNSQRITWAPVSDVGDVRMGKQLSPASRAHGRQYPYLRVANVLEGHIDYSDVKTMGFSDRELEIYGLLPGDILLNEGQESLNMVGRSAIYHGKPAQYFFQNTLIRFRPGTMVNPRYAHHVFVWWRRTGVFARTAEKTSISHLGATRFARLEFPLVPLSDQREIVRVLETLERAEACVMNSFQKLEALRSAFLSSLNVSKSAPQRTLSDVLAYAPQNGLYKPASAYTPTGTPIVRIDSFSGGPSNLAEGLQRIETSGEERSHYGIHEGDILINRVNTPGLVGKSTMVKKISEPTIFESNIMRCKIDQSQARPRFIEAWLSTETARSYFRTHAKSAISQASINQQDVLACPIPDMTLPQQDTFLKQIKFVDACLSSDEAELVKLRNLKDGLMDDLLSGRVAVPEVE